MKGNTAHAAVLFNRCCAVLALGAVVCCVALCVSRCVVHT
jgi:hypothetical protein